MGWSRTEKRALATKLTKSRDTTKGLYSNPGHQPCACRGSSPALSCAVTTSFHRFFSGSGMSNHAPQTMGIAVALSYIATAIPLRWRQMMAHSKAHDPIRWLEWASANQTDNNVADMVIPLAPLNLRWDSMAPAGAKRAVSFHLI